MTTKEKLKEYLQHYKKEYAGLEDVISGYDTHIHIKDLCFFIEQDFSDNDFKISIEVMNTDSDDYIMATYYSEKLNKSIILDWNVDVYFKDEDNLIETLFELNKQAHELESKINNQ